MSINAIADNTRVTLPDGREGRVRVTRRERKLIAGGKKHDISVLCSDGLQRVFPLDQLIEAEHNVGAGGNEKGFENGDCIYIGARFIGRWVGINPETLSHVVYDGDENTYWAYHEHQIDKHKAIGGMST